MSLLCEFVCSTCNNNDVVSCINLLKFVPNTQLQLFEQYCRIVHQKNFFIKHPRQIDAFRSLSLLSHSYCIENMNIKSDQHNKNICFQRGKCFTEYKREHLNDRNVCVYTYRNLFTRKYAKIFLLFVKSNFHRRIKKRTDANSKFYR